MSRKMETNTIVVLAAPSPNTNRYPKPMLPPTISPTTTPITASVAPTLSPEMSAGIEAGNSIFQKICERRALNERARLIKSERQVLQGALTTTTGYDQLNDFHPALSRKTPLDRGHGFQFSIIRIAETFGDVHEF